MSNIYHLQFELCYEEAKKRVAFYRSEAPEGYDPENYVGLAIAAVVLAIAAATVSAVATYQQGQTQKKIGEYNAKVANNAAVATRNEAEVQATRIRERARRLEGAQVAGASKSGITLSGSVNDVMYDSSIQSEQDALLSIYKGQRGASDYTDKARLDRYAAEQAGSLGTLAAGGTLLSGLSGAAASGYRYWSSTQTQPTIT